MYLGSEGEYTSENTDILENTIFQIKVGTTQSLVNVPVQFSVSIVYFSKLQP